MTILIRVVWILVAMSCVSSASDTPTAATSSSSIGSVRSILQSAGTSVETLLADFVQRFASEALKDCAQVLRSQRVPRDADATTRLCTAFAAHCDVVWREQLLLLSADDEAALRSFLTRVAAQPPLQVALHADLRIHVAMLTERLLASDAPAAGADLFAQLLVAEFFVAFWLRVVPPPADAAAPLRETAALVADFRQQFQHVVAQQAVEAGLATVDTGACGEPTAAGGADSPAAAAAARGPGRPVKLKMRDSPSKPQQAKILKQQTADDVKRVLNDQKPKEELKDEL
jgi:hypothetical protein